MSNKPTVEELSDQLKDLVQWQPFALFLPGIIPAHVAAIDQE